MNYKQKSDKFKDLVYAANKDINALKWKNKEELEEYLKKHGGKIKNDRKRKKGYLVCLLQKGRHLGRDDLVAEVPMEFAMKVLVFGFP